MPSDTSITRRKRKRRHRALGKANRKQRIKRGTPKFPLDPAAAATSQ